MVGKVNYGSLPFKEQITYFRRKTNVSTERWNDIWKNAHDRSFMVAGAMKDDLLADFRGAVDKAISEGKSLKWFQSQFDQIVAKHGWEHYGEADWRSQLIYDTNMRMSYTAGRKQQIEALKGSRPYGIYKHFDSEHPRELHLKWNNLVLPLDDPWWKTHTPINGYHCHCKKLTASKRTLERLGLSVGKAPKVEYYEFVDKETGEAHQVPKGIDPGFDYTPRTSKQLTAHTKKIIKAKPPLEERLTPRVVESAFSTIKNVNAQTLSDALSAVESEQIKQLTQIINKHDLKTLFIKSGEMSGKQKGRAISDDVESYLQSGRRLPLVLYSHRRPTRVGGFTSQAWDHVVVKAKSTDSFKSVDVLKITSVLEDMLKNGDTPFTFSSVVRSQLDDNHGLVTTWLHEMGHQVHYKSGLPTMPTASGLSRYGSSSEREFFAEHFVLYVLAPEVLNDYHPDIYKLINDAVRDAL